MIELDVIQGTDAWHKARAGIPTASMFEKILTPKGLQYSAQAAKYENRLAAERFTGTPQDDFGGTRWIERGKELEGDAVQFYGMATGFEVRHVGLILNDARTFGGSPDGLIVGHRRGLEMKCPAPDTHVGYFDDPKSLYEEYKHQVQGNLFVSGFEVWDVISYHPEMPLALYEATPDKEYHEALAAALAKLEENIQRKVKKLKGDI